MKGSNCVNAHFPSLREWAKIKLNVNSIKGDIRSMVTKKQTLEEKVVSLLVLTDSITDFIVVLAEFSTPKGFHFRGVLLMVFTKFSTLALSIFNTL
jgi:hypothetical protein